MFEMKEEERVRRRRRRGWPRGNERKEGKKRGGRKENMEWWKDRTVGNEGRGRQVG